MHVAAVSSGNPTPYPNVNNTERWQTLAASCPYDFTILGRDEVWLGDKGVTKNKLMYYAKCDVRYVLDPYLLHGSSPAACDLRTYAYFRLVFTIRFVIARTYVTRQLALMVAS